MNLSNYGPGDEITWPAYTGGANDPRNDDFDPDELDANTARDMARDQLCTTSAGVADWLAKVCDTDAGWTAVSTEQVDEADIHGAPAHILLALILTGTNEQAQAARHELRRAFIKASRSDIDDRAAELLREANGVACEL